MKKLFLFAVCCLSYMISHGQGGFFVQPSIGGGTARITGIENTHGFCDCGVSTGKQEPQLSLSASIKGGYEFKFVRLTTGLELLRTGAVQNAHFDYFPSGILHTTPLSDKYAHYDHVFIPISMTLIMMPISKTWAVTPELGTRIAFLSQNGQHMTGGFLFSGKLNVEKKLNDHVKILVTPAYYRTTTPVTLTSSAGMNDQERAANTIFQIEGSMLWYFRQAERHQAEGLKPKDK